MSKSAQPVLSVIVRRFRPELRDEIAGLVEETHLAVSKQPGFMELQDSLSEGRNGCELVTVFSFDSRENLKRWENSQIREEVIRKLDRLSLDIPSHSKFDGLSLLVSPGVRISKIETVAILIFLILVVGGLLNVVADFLLPRSFGSLWRHILLVAVNVILISYLFLPWSSKVLSRLKARLPRSAKGKRG